MNFLVFDYHLVFELSDLDFDHLIGFLDLKVGNLRTKRLDFFSDFLNQLSSLCFVEFGRPSWHHLYNLAVSSARRN